ncbi:hypothetical protein CYLTODRAFT_344065 [Cylindrobasidium torrendii FP15055 ss-10]|uniref:Xylanolytic transcriptional activator regulatory domain-containing protein n=1 Tax=Cylindrobasidium torrendii FP15055 ss-10 TaxID=1314674 RepID=A0A0D7BQE1_9AGAR|nr:hypothetical protein CYLTODRAFT_344065 [Cylindrobasidium torrendii FP15055 ss-10]
MWSDAAWKQPWHDEDDRVPYIFPEDDLLKDLVDLYYAEVDCFYNLLHRPTFERRVFQDRMHHSDASFGGLVLLVCALGAKHSSDPRVLLDNNEQTAGWLYYQQVRPHVTVLVRTPKLCELQLYALSSIFLCASTHSEHGWIFPGFGLRLAQAVGAHKKMSYTTSPTVGSEELKRVFWVLYTMDIVLALHLGRPLAAQTDDHDVDYPLECDYEYWENGFVQPDGTTSKVSAFVKMLELMEWMATTHRTLYAIRRSRMGRLKSLKSTIIDIDSALNRWIATMPSVFTWNPLESSDLLFKQTGWLYTHYFFAQILLHRPLMSLSGMTCALPHPSLTICVNSARGIYRIIDATAARGFAASIPTPQIIMFYISVVILIHVWKSPYNDRYTSNLDTDMFVVHRFIKILLQQEKRWQTAGRLVDKLNAFIAEAKEFPGASQDGGVQTQKVELPAGCVFQPSSPMSIPAPPMEDVLPLFTDELGTLGNMYTVWDQGNEAGRLSGEFLEMYMGDFGGQIEPLNFEEEMAMYLGGN